MTASVLLQHKASVINSIPSEGGVGHRATMTKIKKIHKALIITLDLQKLQNLMVCE